MYTHFFNLREPPFSIAPNPRYLYMSPKHREALAHLLYGIQEEGGGFVALTGEVGTGKTTLCRCLLEQLPDNVDVALIFNPRLDATELLASLCDELHVEYPAGCHSLKVLSDALNRHLLAAHATGRRTVALIDEAQNLSFDVLEQVRLLTNLETSQTKLLQVILVGQPELKRLLDRPNLRQLAQRITARYHLRPLSLAETRAYIRHRLEVAGCRTPLFTRDAIVHVQRLSGGVPRLINVICDRALLGSYGQAKPRVGAATVRRAAREVLSPMARPVAHPALLLGLAASLALAAVLVHYRYGPWEQEPAVKPAPALAAVHVPLSQAMAANPSPSPQPAVTPVAVADSPSFATLLETRGASRDAALARLLGRWGVKELPPGADPCGIAGTQGLSCLSQQGGWAELRKLNLPAVLEFTMPDGRQGFAVLVGVAGSKLTLEIGEREYPFDPLEVLSLWEGRYTLLWKPPVARISVVKPGRSSPAVLWLRQQLDPAGEDARPPPNPAFFDARLAELVRALQGSLGLSQDGVVGPQTFIHLLNRTPAPGVPRLAPQPE